MNDSYTSVAPELGMSDKVPHDAARLLHPVAVQVQGLLWRQFASLQVGKEAFLDAGSDEQQLVVGLDVAVGEALFRFFLDGLFHWHRASFFSVGLDLVGIDLGNIVHGIFEKMQVVILAHGE